MHWLFIYPHVLSWWSLSHSVSSVSCITGSKNLRALGQEKQNQAKIFGWCLKPLSKILKIAIHVLHENLSSQRHLEGVLGRKGNLCSEEFIEPCLSHRLRKLQLLLPWIRDPPALLAWILSRSLCPKTPPKALQCLFAVGWVLWEATEAALPN